jgi:hypothetical protein
MVKATIFGCKRLLGIREAVHFMAQKHFGQHFQSKAETFYYESDDLKVSVVFDAKDKAQGFRLALSSWHLEQSLVMPSGKISVDYIQSVEPGD